MDFYGSNNMDDCISYGMHMHPWDDPNRMYDDPVLAMARVITQPSITKVYDTSVEDFISDDVLRLISLLKRGYGNGAKFAMSRHTLYNRIYRTKTSVGDYIFTKDNQNDTIIRLFGFPIVVDDFVPDNTVLFGNFKYYGVNIPEGIAVEVSRESGFTSGLIDYRAMAVADGKPLIGEAFAKLEITE